MNDKREDNWKSGNAAVVYGDLPKRDKWNLGIENQDRIWGPGGEPNPSKEKKRP